MEAARQENFALETVRVWYDEMQKRGWTEEFFLHRVRAVMDSKPFGATKFFEFVDADALYTEEEKNLAVETEIDRRKHEYLALRNHRVDEEELAREGLIDVQEYYRWLRMQWIDAKSREIRKKVKRLRADYFLLPQEAKNELWTKAVEKQLVKADDPFPSELLPLLIPSMISDFEQSIKDYSGK